MISMFLPGLHERRTDFVAVLKLMIDPIQQWLFAVDVAFPRINSSLE